MIDLEVVTVLRYFSPTLKEILIGESEEHYAMSGINCDLRQHGSSKKLRNNCDIIIVDCQQIEE